MTDEATQQVVGTEPERETRQRRSVQAKRQMVEATMMPGSSIARVARARGVNANQLFHWRKLYKQGLLEDPGNPRLLPVRVTDVDREMAANVGAQERSIPTIRIEIAGKARVSIESADERCLRTVLECLLR